MKKSTIARKLMGIIVSGGVMLAGLGGVVSAEEYNPANDVAIIGESIQLENGGTGKVVSSKIDQVFSDGSYTVLTIIEHTSDIMPFSTGSKTYTAKYDHTDAGITHGIAYLTATFAYDNGFDGSSSIVTVYSHSSSFTNPEKFSRPSYDVSTNPFNQSKTVKMRYQFILPFNTTNCSLSITCSTNGDIS